MKYTLTLKHKPKDFYLKNSYRKKIVSWGFSIKQNTLRAQKRNTARLIIFYISFCDEININMEQCAKHSSNGIEHISH